MLENIIKELYNELRLVRPKTIFWKISSPNMLLSKLTRVPHVGIFQFHMFPSCGDTKGASDVYVHGCTDQINRHYPQSKRYKIKTMC